MKAISAPKFSISAPKLYEMKKAPIRAVTPTNITLLRGTRRLGSTAPKNDLGQRVAASHAVEQASSTELGCQAGAEVGHDQREVHYTEQPGATRAAGNVHVRRFDFGKRLGSRPHQLRDVAFQGREQADRYAGEHGGEKNVAPGIFDLFGESRDAVEANVGEDGDGGAAQNRADFKGCGIEEAAW